MSFVFSVEGEEGDEEGNGRECLRVFVGEWACLDAVEVIEEEEGSVGVIEGMGVEGGKQ